MPNFIVIYTCVCLLSSLGALKKICDCDNLCETDFDKNMTEKVLA